jgi:hypothetical protein
VIDDISRKVDSLHEWHNISDEEGVKIWYLRKSLEKTLEKLVENTDRQTEILRDMLQEQRQMRRELDSNGQ